MTADDVRRFTAAAEGGCTVAAFNLAVAYEEGARGLPQSFTLAAKWFLKSAEGGNTQGQRAAGDYYTSGRGGLPLNSATAAVWYRKAALQGDADAQAALGSSYFGGLGVAPDWKLAEEWLTKAAAQGHKEAKTALWIIAETPDCFNVQASEGFASARADLAARATESLNLRSASFTAVVTAVLSGTHSGPKSFSRQVPLRVTPTPPRCWPI